MPYPVTVTMTPLLAPRNKMTTAFRLVLAIPHLFLVGGIGFSMVFRTRSDNVTSLGPFPASGRTRGSTSAGACAPCRT